MRCTFYIEIAWYFTIRLTRFQSKHVNLSVLLHPRAVPSELNFRCFLRLLTLCDTSLLKTLCFVPPSTIKRLIFFKTTALRTTVIFLSNTDNCLICNIEFCLLRCCVKITSNLLTCLICYLSL